MPPAPVVLPLHPLLELPAPGLSPLQALLPVEQALRANVDPAIRLAIQKPAMIFLRSLASILASCNVEDAVLVPLGWEPGEREDLGMVRQVYR